MLEFSLSAISFRTQRFSIEKLLLEVWYEHLRHEVHFVKILGLERRLKQGNSVQSGISSRFKDFVNNNNDDRMKNRISSFYPTSIKSLYR